MACASLHPLEPARIEALLELGILDSGSEAAFDDLVGLAAQIADTPIALFSLVDADRQWFKSRVGVLAEETPRAHSFCAHAIVDCGTELIVENATLDVRFADNPLVLFEPRIRFYAGFPVFAPARNLPIGTLCVIDSKPRSISSEQIASIRLLASQIERLLALRLSELAKEKALVALQSERVKLRGMLDNSQSFLGMVNLKGELIDCSQRSGCLPRWNSSQATGKPLWDLACFADSPDVQASLRHSFAEALSGKVSVVDAISSGGDGDRVELQCHFSPIHDDKGQVVFVVPEVRDVTSHRNAVKRVEVAQREARRSDFFVEHSSEAIYWIQNDGRFVHVNRAACRLLGYERKQLLQMNASEVDSIFATDQFGQLWERLKTEREHRVEARHSRGDGIQADVSLDLYFQDFEGEEYLVGVAKDIRHTKAIECRLKSLGEVIERSRNEIYIFGTESLRFKYANRGAIQNLGYSVEELESMTPLDLKPEFTVEAFRETIAPLQNGERDHLTFETVHERKNGSLYQVDVNLQLTIYDDEPCFVAIILDTTRLKDAIESLTKANDELERFAHVASHDLRSPLRGISSIASFIRDDDGKSLSESSLRYLDKLDKRVSLMQKLLDDLFAYSGVDRRCQSVNRVDVSAVIDDVIELVGAPDGFEVDQKTAMPVLRTHVAPLKQIFLNLIGNAVKYHDGVAGRIEISSREKEQFVEFSVSDDGPGIESKYHGKIFEIFQRLDRNNSQGTGMGLALVRRLVDEHGGDVWVESEPGHGATFSFLWPKNIEMAVA